MPSPVPKQTSRRGSKNFRTLPPNDRLADLRDLTVPELKQRCRGRGLRVGGRREDLIRRLAFKDLPDIPNSWHPNARRFWDDIWASPMSPEWDDSDIHNAYILAMLYNDFWQAETPYARQALSSEIRLARQALGLSPLDRHRLYWTIEQADSAEARGRKRRAAETPAPAAPKPDPGIDPREVLRAVE
jgi:hypothetical protein